MKINQKDIGNLTFFDENVSVLPFIHLTYIAGTTKKQDIKTNGRLDYKKIKNYFQIQVSMKTRRNGQPNRYYRSDFISCPLDYFEGMGLSKSQNEDIQNNIHEYLCIDKHKLRDTLMLQNGYTANDRISFSVEIVSCMQGSSCHNETEVKNLFSEIAFTKHIIRKQVDFNKEVTQGMQPTIVYIQFFQQFMIEIDRYIDNNNFLRKNVIETKNNIVSSLLDNYEFSYYDVIQKPTWSVRQRFFNKNHLTTYDGINYSLQDRQIYYGCFFFLNNEMLVHEKQVYTVAQFISEIGGLFSIVFTVIELIIAPIIYRFNIGHIIKQVNLDEEEDREREQKEEEEKQQQRKSYNFRKMMRIS